MYNFEDQMNQFREHAARAGFSGNAIIDVRPGSGIIRIKVDTTPPESLRSFITGYTQFLDLSLRSMNVQARIHIAEEEKG